MTKLNDSSIMDIEETDGELDINESEDHQETIGRFHATMDQRNRSNITSRIIQSDSIMQMEMNDNNNNNDDDTNEHHPEQPQFPKLTLQQQQQQQQQQSSTTGSAAKYKIEYRRIRCPSHRYTPLREHWEQILTPLVEYLKLQVRWRYIYFLGAKLVGVVVRVCAFQMMITITNHNIETTREGGTKKK
jgi:hypothetical protein